MSDKKKIAVAVVKSITGMNQRVELLTVADVVHIFALAMGYRPDIAFAFGVISRSVPEVQAGEGDVALETAKKAIQLASLISSCREKKSMPEELAQSESVLAATAHIHNIEQAYGELCEKVPGMQETFSQQYNDWFRQQEQARVKPSIIRRLVGLLKK